MRIAFIGGTRFIGHASATWAVERGHEVSVVHRGRHPSQVPGARSVLANRADPSALIKTLAELAPDVLVDTRAMKRPDAQVTALALKILQVPGVVLSSQDVYAQYSVLLGRPCPEPEALVSETSPLGVPYPYRGIREHEGGEHYDKKDVEAEFVQPVSDTAAGVTLLRLPATYGSRDRSRRWGAVVDALDAGTRTLPHIRGGSLRWTQAHVRDVAHAVVLAAERAERQTQIYNVGAATTPTARERVETIAQAMSRSFSWQEENPLPPGFEELGAFAHDFVVDDTLIRRALGFAERTSEEDRMADLVAWLRKTGPS